MAKIPIEEGSIYKAFLLHVKALLGKSPSQRGEAQMEGRVSNPEGSKQKKFLTPGKIENTPVPNATRVKEVTNHYATERRSSFCTGKSNIVVTTTPVGVWSNYSSY